MHAITCSRTYKRFFFEKLRDWRDEAEYRWVVIGDAPGDLYVELRGALIGLVFGEHTDDLAIKEMMDITASWGLRYMGLRWKNCSPWYDFGNMRYLLRASARHLGQGPQ
jgi:hypothetical protein